MNITLKKKAENAEVIYGGYTYNAKMFGNKESGFRRRLCQDLGCH